MALKGIWQPSSMASLASLSALSFPLIPQWLGHHKMEILRFSCAFSRGCMVWWNLSAKKLCCLGLGSMMVVVAAALSVKNAM